MNITLWVVQIILGLAFLVFGSKKVFQYEKTKASMPWVSDHSKGLVIFIGFAELLGGLGLILPWLTGIWPGLTSLAALGLGVVMILATIFHIKRKESQAVGTNIIFLLLALFVVYGRWFM